MKHSIQVLGAAFMVASLAACGGGGGSGDGDGGSGGSGNDGGSGGGNGGGSGGAPLTVKQVQWYGHEAAFTGVSLAGLAVGLRDITVSGSFEPGVKVELACEDGGSFTRVFNDANANGGVDKGDSFDLEFLACGSTNGLLNGKALLTIGEGSYDEQAGRVVRTSVVSLGPDFKVDETQMRGAFTLNDAFSIDSGTGLVISHSDYHLSIPALHLASSFAGSTYETKIANYQADFLVFSGSVSQSVVLNSLAFSASGSDPILGDGYSYEATVSEAAHFSHDWIVDGSSFSEGVFEVVARGETIKVGFSYDSKQNTAGAVTFTSTGGATSTLTYAEFDDLAP